MVCWSTVHIGEDNLIKMPTFSCYHIHTAQIHTFCFAAANYSICWFFRIFLIMCDILGTFHLYPTLSLITALSGCRDKTGKCICLRSLINSPGSWTLESLLLVTYLYTQVCVILKNIAFDCINLLTNKKFRQLDSIFLLWPYVLINIDACKFLKNCFAGPQIFCFLLSLKQLS